MGNQCHNRIHKAFVSKSLRQIYCQGFKIQTVHSCVVEKQQLLGCNQFLSCLSLLYKKPSSITENYGKKLPKNTVAAITPGIRRAEKEDHHAKSSHFMPSIMMGCKNPLTLQIQAKFVECHMTYVKKRTTMEMWSIIWYQQF